MPSRPVDYTSLGFDALREAMLDVARESVPEWTDFSENDLGMVLIDLFAYACDVTLYYQTRIANNLFPATADEPAAFVQLLRLIGYELRPPAPAVADLQLSFDASVTSPQKTTAVIPAGAKFFAKLPTGEELTFETEREYQVQDAQLTPKDERDLRHLLFLLPVVQGSTVSNEPELISDRSPNQMFTLRQKPVVPGSIRLSVEETTQTAGTAGGGVIETRWQEVETLANSGPVDRHYVVQRDVEGAATIIFGDGINGMIPPYSGPQSVARIRVGYRVGGGAKGNVPAGTDFHSELQFVRRAVNPQAAAGGGDAEDIDQARALAPRLFRTQERAVTRQDYVDTALRVPGVGKAQAVALNFNKVALYVTPSGQVTAPSELLRRDLLVAFENRRMLSTSLEIFGPKPVDIYIGATIQAKPYFLHSDVKAAVEKAVADYLAFEAVDFGQKVYLSRIYDAIQSLDSVVSLNIFKFSSSYTPLVKNNVVQTAADVATNGVIELKPNEMPRLGYRDNPTAPADADNPSYRTPIYTVIEGGVPQ